MRRSTFLALRLASILAFFLAWEMTTRGGLVTPFLLTPPTVVAQELWDQFLSGALLMNVWATSRRMLIGLGIAIAIGVPLGIGLARSRALRWFFDPLLSIALPMPLVAFVPVFILWLGVFDASKIALITLSCVFPIIVQTWAGADNIDKFLTWSAQSFGVRGAALVRDVVLPAALPQIITGLQIAMPIALLAAVVTEMLMGGQGIGGSIVMGMRMSDSPEMFAGIVAVGIYGFLLTKLMELLRAWLLSWHQEVQGR